MGVQTSTSTLLCLKQVFCVVKNKLTRLMMGSQSRVDSPASSSLEPKGEALVSMIICMIILIIFFVFFCLIPVYRLLERRWRHWDLIENDPRWNVDTFQFSPSAAATKHSRQSSLRHGQNQGPAPAYSPNDPEALPRPPSYNQLFSEAENVSSLGDGGSPPPYKSVESGVEKMGL